MQQPVHNVGLISVDRKDTSANEGEECKFDRVMALQEEPVQITFLMPDCSTFSKKFKKGHTITVLKACLQDEYDLKQEETQLLLDGVVLLDPLSLTDFPRILKASAVDIQVRRACFCDAKSRK
ncbi:Ubiquitin domain [Plasmopara halstedii]|uniref:Ubiquitin domain n=1 Tax=Plasmopara halstedii TaxID=4781 RepID=A0A0P1AQ37_PLAHL|nr:Ubiquitin domain [Plasmopara halstedii]CEG43484.1 Ubiquitin domain [Plasmopara halstedii]|eukprot:XP_024579853.1 Ubiquitin domain [Plasmopara halstedii]